MRKAAVIAVSVLVVLSLAQAEEHPVNLKVALVSGSLMRAADSNDYLVSPGTVLKASFSWSDNGPESDPSWKVSPADAADLKVLRLRLADECQLELLVTIGDYQETLLTLEASAIRTVRFTSP